MPTWTGNILQTYKVYRDERVRIRNSEIDCRMRMYDNLRYQSIVRYERIVSGRFSPLTAHTTSRSTVFFQVPLCSRSSGFRARLRSIFRSRSAHMLLYHAWFHGTQKQEKYTKLLVILLLPIDVMQQNNPLLLVPNLVNIVLHEYHQNYSHQMPYFSFKIHQIQFRFGFCPRPHWGSSRRPGANWLFLAALEKV